MNKREKIIDLCQPILNFCNANGCKLCLYEAYKPFCVSTVIADNLLRNGVIVPIVKVGDTVYQIDNAGNIYESKVTQVVYNTNGIAFDEKAIGKTVFLTHKEAEKALAKITENK